MNAWATSVLELTAPTPSRPPAEAKPQTWDRKRGRVSGDIARWHRWAFTISTITFSLLGCLLVGPALGSESPADAFRGKRERMVREQIANRGVTNKVVLDAMRRVPRHSFVRPSLQGEAYEDHPLPIGHGQTISQPYIVGLMTELLALKPGDKVLEIGTGSGYQAAILAEITTNVYTIEIVRPLYEQAKEKLSRIKRLDEDHVRHGDGYFGLPAHAPFDAIIVTAAADHIPPPLLRQLKPGGRMVIPIGPVHLVQRLVLVEKDANGKVKTRSVLPVSFVPLTGGPDSLKERE